MRQFGQARLIPVTLLCDVLRGAWLHGEGLFKSVVMAMRSLPLPQLWSFLFFLMLITLGLDSAFAIIDTVTTAIEETFGCVRRSNRDENQ